MNSPFVAIVRSSGAVYGEVTPLLADFTRLKPYHTYVAVYVVTHSGMDPGAAIVTRPSQ